MTGQYERRMNGSNIYGCSHVGYSLFSQSWQNGWFIIRKKRNDAPVTTFKKHHIRLQSLGSVTENDILQNSFKLTQSRIKEKLQPHINHPTEEKLPFFKRKKKKLLQNYLYTN